MLNNFFPWLGNLFGDEIVRAYTVGVIPLLARLVVRRLLRRRWWRW